MSFLILLVILLVLCFGFVILYGAPYLPTLKKETEAALDLLDLKPGQTLLELGCGDGKVLKAAARRGIKSVGYELNPLLVIVAKVTTYKYRRCTKVIWGNFWSKDWPPAEGIFVFLHTRFMKRLGTKLLNYSYSPVKVVSYTFIIPGKKPDKVSGALYFYKY